MGLWTAIMALVLIMPLLTDLLNELRNSSKTQLQPLKRKHWSIFMTAAVMSTLSLVLVYVQWQYNSQNYHYDSLHAQNIANCKSLPTFKFKASKGDLQYASTFGLPLGVFFGILFRYRLLKTSPGALTLLKEYLSLII